MNKYHNSKIYTIRSHQTNKFYIGSTCQKYLCYRFNTHKQHYNQFINDSYNYVSSFDILQFDDAYIELLENFKCESREELTKRESELLKQYKDHIVNINTNTAKDTKEYIKDYYIENKEDLKSYKKKYYLENINMYRERNKKYRQNKKKI